MLRYKFSKHEVVELDGNASNAVSSPSPLWECDPSLLSILSFSFSSNYDGLIVLQNHRRLRPIIINYLLSG